MIYRVYYRSSGKIEFQVRKLAEQLGITSMRRVTIGSSSFTATAEQVVSLQDGLAALAIESHVIAETEYRPQRMSAPSTRGQRGQATALDLR